MASAVGSVAQSISEYVHIKAGLIEQKDARAPVRSGAKIFDAACVHWYIEALNSLGLLSSILNILARIDGISVEYAKLNRIILISVDHLFMLNKWIIDAISII